jgi:phosphatidylglycerol:prolipoprotein diacylglycerol transferase
LPFLFDGPRCSRLRLHSLWDMETAMKYPNIDPVLIDLGPLQIRWYGLMYVIAFLLAYTILIRVSRAKKLNLTKQDIGDFLTHAIIGVILGARLGYCIIYNGAYYFQNPWRVFAVWEGGMSFHGGLAGILLAGWLYTRRRRKSFWVLADLTALAAPLGLFFGRIGNFINGELIGRVTDSPLGMVFPGAGSLPRHPSQLYEAMSEGILLFFILLLISRKKGSSGVVLAAFFLGYGCFRFFIEFFREPDPQVGFIFDYLTMGQILCLAMIIVGSALLGLRLKARPNTAAS